MIYKRFLNIYLISILPLLTLLQGGFFPWSFIPILVCSFLLIAFNKEYKIPLKSAVLIGVTFLCFLLSTAFYSQIKIESIFESIKILYLLLGLWIGFNISKGSIFNSIIISSLLLGFIGILAMCKLITFTDAVFLDGNILRLQSTMQYANSTAVILTCGIFALKSFPKSNLLCMLEIFLIIALLFTFSRFAIILWIISTLILSIRNKNGLFEGALILFSVIIFAIMYYLIYEKLSFIAFIFLIFSLPLCARLSFKIKKDNLLIIILTSILGTCLIFYCLYKFNILNFDTLINRFINIKDAIKIIFKNPLLGTSPLSWFDKREYFEVNFSNSKYIHNGYLQIAVDGGLVALISFLFMLYYNIKNLIYEKQTILIIIIFIILVHSFLDFDFAFSNILFTLGLCLAFGERRGKINE